MPSRALSQYPRTINTAAIQTKESLAMHVFGIIEKPRNPARAFWLCASFGMLLTMATAVQAANFSSVQSGDWDNAATWGGGGFPGGGDDVTINTGHQVNVTTTEGALNLTLASGAVLQINGFQLMMVNGDITVNSTAVLQGGFASAFRFNGATFTNNGTVSAPQVDFNGNGAATVAGSGE